MVIITFDVLEIWLKYTAKLMSFLLKPVAYVLYLNKFTLN